MFALGESEAVAACDLGSEGAERAMSWQLGFEPVDAVMDFLRGRALGSTAKRRWKPVTLRHPDRSVLGLRPI